MLVIAAMIAALPPAAGAMSPPQVTAPLAASPPIETKDQRKARERAAKEQAKQAKAVAKAADKARRDAERAAHPKKSSALLNCIAGGVIAGGLAAIFGAKGGGIAKAAGAGCLAGWGLGEALKGQDEKRLNTYLSDDYIERDDLATTSWAAPESGQTLTVQTTGEEFRTMNHLLNVDNDVVFDPANIRVSVRKMRVIEAVSLRTAPRAAPDTVKGSFRVGDIVKVYGETLDGKYAYLTETNPDGSLTIVGYGNSTTLSPNLSVAPAQRVQMARHTAPPARKLAARRVKGKVVAPPPVAVAAVPTRKIQIAAITRCKNVRVSTSAGKSGSQSLCGGGTNVA